MLIDTHAHLFKEYDKDRAEVIQRALDNGVEKIINIGCNLQLSQTSIDLAAKYDNIYASVGIHPHDGDEDDLGKAMAEIHRLAQQPKVVAIGEIGLDYFSLEKESEKEVQKKLFREQLAIAKELDLPVILHCRDAYQDMLKILQSDKVNRGVAHCFLGNREAAKRFIEQGLHLSFTGVITFKKQDEILQVVKETPLEKIMVETDCPYLAPEPNRGKRNEPAYVRQIAEQVATIKEIGMDKIEETTTNNAINLFNLN
ncbi:MAG: TatD family hydrolase [Parcubacteria group bacterium]|nr:TatD family hydrolase [Parcubacteria group bacterium]